MNNIGSIIAELRKEAGYTQKTLANALNVTDKAVSKWERGICFPDSFLLPKLSLLLGVDVSLLLNDSQVNNEKWVGVLDLEKWNINLEEIVYDKPMVYYLLSYFSLLGITKIYVRTSKRNMKYLKNKYFYNLGFRFDFNIDGITDSNLMILNRPLFIFGSDLTRIFMGTMYANKIIKLVPEAQGDTFLFCPMEYAFMYLKNPNYLYEIASKKTLGRGMINMNMSDKESINDVSNFVRLYQSRCGLLIGDLEEIIRNKMIAKENR